MKIAIMQPAFLPPASYLRLFAAVDLFVILDDVQFNRRWYTHRQKLTKLDGTKDWLTLPIKKTSRDDTRIMDMEWADEPEEKFRSQLRKFSANSSGGIEQFFNKTPCALVTGILKEMCDMLDLDAYTIRSSELTSSPELHGQDKLIAICKKLKASEYINSPGGKYLYDPRDFARQGIKLTFLPDYKGGMDSVIHRHRTETPEEIRKEIMENI